MQHDRYTVDALGTRARMQPPARASAARPLTALTHRDTEYQCSTAKSTIVTEADVTRRPSPHTQSYLPHPREKVVHLSSHTRLIQVLHRAPRAALPGIGLGIPQPPHGPPAEITSSGPRPLVKTGKQVTAPGRQIDIGRPLKYKRMPTQASLARRPKHPAPARPRAPPTPREPTRRTGMQTGRPVCPKP